MEFNKPAPLKMTGNLSQNFKFFKQQIEIYMTATETDEKSKTIQVARLLNLMGTDALKVYSKTNEIKSHYKFCTSKQNDENFDVYLTRLKELVKPFNFGTLENKLLKAQIVLGIRCRDTLERLLREDMTLDQVVAFCQSVEAAEKNCKELESKSEVHHIAKQTPAAVSKQKTTINNCTRCGKTHLINKCFTFGKICNKCKRMNHFSNLYSETGSNDEDLVISINQVEIKETDSKKWSQDGFHQIQLEKESSNYCTFSSPFGCYRFLRAPFGLSSIPEIFQKPTHKYFGDIENVIVYFDDILCATNLGKKWIKLFKYLGLLFPKDGMKPDDNRITAIKELKIPSNKKELQQILGVINYLRVRQFIPNLSELSSPFRELMKNNVLWQWTNKDTGILEKIKTLIAETSALNNFDMIKQITVQCDNSQNALGCCLWQDNKSVAFASRSLISTEINYAQIEKNYYQ
ncbi:uncharacterized protein LOC111027197 [Myzus persicae]|uniref:uncharacterized protein LOC111027197 n=1 Tax=Myzus persicae TaxID=13164 RepID=UPI000B92FC51|nr:uncharacterized protein LOC111027197 [Myzus persicae]